MMKNKIEFEAIILQHKNINAAYINFPFSTEELFGKRGQVKVKVIFDEKVEYRGSLTKMGGNCHRLGVTQDIRKSLNKTFGDTIKVELWQDLEERTIEIPNDVIELFKQYQNIEDTFAKLSYTQRKELIRWITEAKKPETREKRKQQMVKKLLEKEISK